MPMMFDVAGHENHKVCAWLKINFDIILFFFSEFLHTLHSHSGVILHYFASEIQNGEPKMADHMASLDVI